MTWHKVCSLHSSRRVQREHASHESPDSLDSFIRSTSHDHHDVQTVPPQYPDRLRPLLAMRIAAAVHRPAPSAPDAGSSVDGLLHQFPIFALAAQPEGPAWHTPCNTPRRAGSSGSNLPRGGDRGAVAQQYRAAALRCFQSFVPTPRRSARHLDSSGNMEHHHSRIATPEMHRHETRV